MSQKELTRLEIIQKVAEREMRQAEAARLLGISPRQVRRLLRQYRVTGAAGLVSKRRGQPSPNKLPEKERQQALKWLRKHYADFGPTLASEKLAERHGLLLSVESVRQLMIAEGLWQPRRRRQARVHPQRRRRACVGELIQIDGSPHRWFEDRGPACTLLAQIDDASSQVMDLLFTPQETTFRYFAITRHYLNQHGLPLAFYSDKHGIFRLNQPKLNPGDGLTQFGRALHQLGIQSLCANTPQAKGRVERLFLTLQDRLVKELRLRKIASIQQANAFLPQFLVDYNRRFAVQPASAHNAHRPLKLSPSQLDQIFSLHETRTLSKNLSLQYQNVVYQIQTTRPAYALRQAPVTVCQSPQGQITILYKGRPLDYSTLHTQPRQAEVVSSKAVNPRLDRHPQSPHPNHPWRNYGHRLDGSPIPEIHDPTPESGHSNFAEKRTF